MTNRAPLVGWSGIAGIATIVVLVDNRALRDNLETLSTWFRRHRRLAGPVWGALTWHLVCGDVRVLNDRWHDQYTRYHPLWRLAFARSGIGRSTDVITANRRISLEQAFGVPVEPELQA